MGEMDSALRMHTTAPDSNSNDLIGPKEAGTLWALFCERVERSPDAVAYREYDYSARCWRDYSWRMMAIRVDNFRAAFVGEGLQSGDRIAVLMPNGVDWMCFDMAAHGQGLVVVALYPRDSAADHAYILADSDARLALVDSLAQWDLLRREPVQFPALARVWIRDAGPELGMSAKNTITHRLADVLNESPAVPPPCDGAPGALATLIYTSGTTGRPKGVMLSHAALLWNSAAVAAIIPPRRDDVFLSVLPLAHAFERTVGCYLAMMGGATVTFSRSPQDLAEDMKMQRPTVLLAVPRLFERIYAAIRKRSEANWVSNVLLRLFAWLGWRRFDSGRKSGGKPSFALSVLLYFLDRTLGKTVKASLGGRLRVAVSGGAALDPKIARFLIGVGFPLVEGYGLTEAGPVVTATAVDDTLPGSVGRPLPGVDVKLGAANELLVRSPGLMLGYWKDKAETSRTQIDSGWLATGDIADIIENRVFIRGRLKEIILLTIGEKINPCLIETEIARDPLVQQVSVVGDGRPFLAVLAVLDVKAWQLFAEANEVDADQPNGPKAKALILARWTERLSAFPRHAQIHAVHLSLEPWTIQAGLLTPTLKIKRQALQQRFARDIEALYAAHQVPKP